MEKQYKPFEVEVNALGFYVNRAFSMMVKSLNKELRNADLNIQHAEFSIMKLLNEIKGGTQSQLATLLGKERSGISRTLSQLEEKGYISRQPLDGKTNYVVLTQKGQELMPGLNAIADKVSKKTFKGFSKKSQESIVNNLTKIYLNALSNLDTTD